MTTDLVRSDQPRPFPRPFLETLPASKTILFTPPSGVLSRACALQASSSPSAFLGTRWPTRLVEGLLQRAPPTARNSAALSSNSCTAC